MKTLAALFLFFIAIPLHAQFGNEWVNTSQPYAKIPVASEGLYHISDSLLKAIGFPSGFDPRRLQLFHKGVEQPILVSGENDGVFHSTDFIQFYGRKNDGSIDNKLYESQASQPHTLASIFNDTTFYFLTVGETNGKRITQTNIPNQGYPEYTYHLDEKINILAEAYAEGVSYFNQQVIDSKFTQGEGFMGSRILHGNSASYKITGIQRTASSISKPVLEIQVTGRGPMNHVVDINIGPTNRLWLTTTVNGFESKTLTNEIEWTDINNGEINILVYVKLGNATAARASVNYLKIKYPQTVDMNGETQYTFHFPSNGSQNSVIKISNSPVGTRLFKVTDLNNIVELATTAGANLEAVLLSENKLQKVFAVNKVIKPSARIITFRDIPLSQQDYLIITHPLLRRPSSSFSDPVKAYAAYRASEAGGKYDTLVLNINTLYDQFSYGDQSPLAIYNLMKYLAQGELPQHLLLIGKGLDIEFKYFKNPGGFPEYKNLVPSGGEPASDAIFTMGLKDYTNSNAVATGRIPATSSEEVSAYLKKVIEKESQAFNDLRKKNVLHLSGGIYPGEPEQFKAFLKDFEPFVTGEYFGGKVDALARNSTEKLLNIHKEVNEGLSLITFFGHSSPVNIDFDIGYVTDPVLQYNNKGKYPVLLMNGCQAGAFFRNTELFGENWVTTGDKGAIAMIAHTSYGFIPQLLSYSGLLYKVAFNDSIYLSKGIGEVQREAAKRFITTNGVSEKNISQVQQMILLGDPAVSLFGAAKPDYEINDDQVYLASLDENAVTAYTDSFAINLVVRNFGQSRNKPLSVQIYRTFGNRQSITYDSVFAPVHYSDTLVFVIRNNSLAYGNNTFEIRVDADNSISEMNEENNVAYIDFFMALNGTENLYPRKFGIVSKTNIDLTFQHTDILSGERQFQVEIDTVATFDSQYKQSFELTSTVLARQHINLLSLDSTVYYWRTKLVDPAEFESKAWSTQSFTYINNGPDGWTQRDFSQLMENTSFGLVKDPEVGLLKFESLKTSIDVVTFGKDAGKPLDSISFKIDGEEYQLRKQGFGCRNNTLNLVAFDKISTAPYLGIFFQWFNRAGRTCGREPWVINSFTYNQMVTGNNDDLVAYITNINVGDSIVLFTIGDAMFSLWPTDAKTKLSEFGISAEQLQSLTDGEPVVIFAKKGTTPGEARIIRSSEPDLLKGSVRTSSSITGGTGTGNLVSTLIGPANEWREIFYHVSEQETSDDYSFDVVGVSKDGKTEVLIEDVSNGTPLSSIDANVYPNIRLIMHLKDTINISPVQLKHWMVSYEPVSEGLIFYKGLREQETITEGVEWHGEFGFINVSDQNFKGDLDVSYTVYNYLDLKAYSENMTITPPAPGDTTLFNIPVNSFKKVGLNDINVTVNENSYPEVHLDNNSFRLPAHLKVIRETFNPILDVTVDGRYIQNDEYVSLTPEIAIQLWDENPYLLKTDTLNMQVFLSNACVDNECVFRRINFSDTIVQWSAATVEKPFLMRFIPPGLTDGRYVLRVEASDQSGNSAAPEPYEIAFQIRSQELSEVSLPFPNPTSGDITIDLNLAGAQLPESVDFEIINLSGLNFGIVRFTNFHYGKNRISFNTRELNEQLSPGLYLYKIYVNRSQRKIGKLVIGK